MYGRVGLGCAGELERGGVVSWGWGGAGGVGCAGELGVCG